jgi:hypothetical protein
LRLPLKRDKEKTMSDDLEVTEQEELARFFAGKIIEQYQAQYSDFDDSEDTIEALTQALLDEYRTGEPYEVSEPDTPPINRGLVDFPLDLNFNLVVGSMNVHIERSDDENEYTILSTFKIAGFKISSSRITIADGKAERTETVGTGPVQVTITFSINFSDPELKLEGHGKIWPFKKFHIGPFSVKL